MKILVFSLQDSGGGCGKLARAIDEHPDHEAKAARWRKGRVVYYEISEQHCLWQPDKKTTKGLIEWCDAIVVTGPWRRLPRKLPWGTRCLIPPGAPRRPLVVNYRGTPYRQERKKYDDYDRSHNVVRSGDFLDLCAYGLPHFLPVPVWEDELRQYRQEQDDGLFRVAQAVTTPKRWHKKDTKEVVAQLGGVDGVELDIITDQPHEEALARLGRADLVVTAFHNGFGNAGLEALAMGIPIVADGFPGLLAKYKEVVGCYPFLRSSPKQLRQKVSWIKDDAEVYRDVLTKGQEYLRTFHHPTAVAEKAVELCRSAKPARY